MLAYFSKKTSKKFWRNLGCYWRHLKVAPSVYRRRAKYISRRSFLGLQKNIATFFDRKLSFRRNFCFLWRHLKEFLDLNFFRILSGGGAPSEAKSSPHINHFATIDLWAQVGLFFLWNLISTRFFLAPLLVRGSYLSIFHTESTGRK